MKTPFESTVHSFQEHFKGATENIKNFYEKLDSFIVWIIGFSISAMGFILLEYKSIKDFFGSGDLKILISFFGASILFGIIYRLLSFFELRFVLVRMSALDVLLNIPNNLMIINNDTTIPNDDISILLARINSEFGIDIERMKSDYLNSADQEATYNRIYDFYINQNAWARQNQKSGYKFVRKMFRNSFGITNRMTIRFFKKTPKRIWLNIFMFSWIKYFTVCFFVLSLTASAVGFLLTFLLLDFN